MARHWYFAVDCKTPGCKRRQLLAYIGEAGGPGAIKFDLPSWEQTPCPSCGAQHQYAPADVKTHSAPSPPLAGWKDKMRWWRLPGGR